MFNTLFKFYWVYFVISLLVIVPGFVVMAKYGIRSSIDFTGGSLLELSIVGSEVDQQALRGSLEKHFPISSFQQSGESSWIVRTKPIGNDQKDLAVSEVKVLYPYVIEQRFESIGPTLGRELLIKTVIAVLVVSIVIMLYVMRQFTEVKYGISAVVAMFHDTAVLFSVFALLGVWNGVEIDVLFVTAVLTTLSFSIHDTIVLFDRIRELKRKYRKENLQSIATLAVLQTITRSFNNSFTIIIMLLTLVLLGGETLRWFATALLVGAITGTYSSIFTAVPVLLSLDNIERHVQKRAK